MRTALVYLLAWPLVALAGLLASFTAIALSNNLDLRHGSAWASWALNLLPTFGCGLGLYAALARRRLRAAPPAPRLLGHLARAAPLYGLAAFLGWYTARHLRDPAFGLYAQLIILPLAATLGAIIADALAAAVPQGSRPARQAAV